MNKIKTQTELFARLKVAGINISEFDYIEGKTKDSYVDSHPFVFRGRRYYRNPYFWSTMFDAKMPEVIEYMYNMPEFYPDKYILSVLIIANHKLANKYFKTLVNYVFKSEAEPERKEKDLDELLLDCSAENRLDLYKILVDIAKELNIKPRYGEFANAADGRVLYNACKEQDGEFAHYLLDHGVDVTLNDSMAYPAACKEANYKLALDLVAAGIDIHTHKDLGKLMILRNMRREENKTLELSEENREAKEKLLALYEEDEKKD